MDLILQSSSSLAMYLASYCDGMAARPTRLISLQNLISAVKVAIKCSSGVALAAGVLSGSIRLVFTHMLPLFSFTPSSKFVNFKVRVSRCSPNYSSDHENKGAITQPLLKSKYPALSFLFGYFDICIQIIPR